MPTKIEERREKKRKKMKLNEPKEDENLQDIFASQTDKEEFIISYDCERMKP